MSMLREGVAASYIGPERGGLMQGDRCWVVSDEGTCLHVRWTSGALEGNFAMLREPELAIDQMPVDDEFGFETAHMAVTVNCAAVLDRGGELALFEALQAEGHMDGLEEQAIQAVASIRSWMDSDPTWATIQDSLGDDAEPVLRSVLAAALTAVTEGE